MQFLNSSGGGKKLQNYKIRLLRKIFNKQLYLVFEQTRQPMETDTITWSKFSDGGKATVRQSKTETGCQMKENLLENINKNQLKSQSRKTSKTYSP